MRRKNKWACHGEAAHYSIGHQHAGAINTVARGWTLGA